ncbi:disheveled-associated activator of morphogenesis 2 [Trichonephila clavipes]|nr:disheveled-associated activator of morphogenesis 2 [Trichonephila clavipes]
MPQTMPAQRRTKGLCGCFGSNEPPEITYHVVENGGIINLQPHPLTPTQPMPDEEELNAKFAELVEELDLTASKKEIMFNLPPEKKWQLYLSKKMEQDEPTTHYPDYYIEKVISMSMLLFPREEEEIMARAKLLDNLKTALRTQPNRPGHQHSLVDAVAFTSYLRHARLERDLAIWLVKKVFDKL